MVSRFNRPDANNNILFISNTENVFFGATDAVLVFLRAGEGGGLPTKSKPAKNKWGKPAMNFKTRAPMKPLGLIVERRLSKALKNKSAFNEPHKRTTKSK